MAFALLRPKPTSPEAVAGLTVAVQLSAEPIATVDEHDRPMLSVVIAVTETLEVPVLG